MSISADDDGFLRRSEVIGACVVSSAGSLPLHLLPLVVAVVVADGRLLPAEAGWIGSCLMLGILVAAIGLPAAGFRRVSYSGIGVGLAVLLGSSIACTSSSTWPLLAGWVGIGSVCGLLHFLGSTSAASYPDRHFVFGLRLVLVLVLAACVIAGFGLLRGLQSYQNTVVFLCAAVALICCCGLLAYRPPTLNGIGGGSINEGVAEAESGVVGLGVAVLFFAGQPGFTAYAAHIAISHGISSDSLPGVYVVCKLAAAPLLFRFGANARSGSPTVLMGVLIAVAVVAMATSRELLIFAGGMLLWEIAVNIQSTRLQATIVTINPGIGGKWIPAAVAVGAGAGPAIHGALIGASTEYIFVVFSVLSGLLPAVWILHRRWGESSPGRLHQPV